MWSKFIFGHPKWGGGGGASQWPVCKPFWDGYTQYLPLNKYTNSSCFQQLIRQTNTPAVIYVFSQSPCAQNKTKLLIYMYVPSVCSILNRHYLSIIFITYKHLSCHIYMHFWPYISSTCTLAKLDANKVDQHARIRESFFKRSATAYYNVCMASQCGHKTTWEKTREWHGFDMVISDQIRDMIYISRG